MIDAYSILKCVDGINLTPREIDIIACILNGKTSQKSIAALLSIQPRTVETHLRNLTQKLDCSSWEVVRDFFDRPHLFSIYRMHYETLCLKPKFIKFLKTISQQAQSKNLCCWLYLPEINIISKAATKEIETYLDAAGILALPFSSEEEIKKDPKNILKTIIRFVADKSDILSLQESYNEKNIWIVCNDEVVSNETTLEDEPVFFVTKPVNLILLVLDILRHALNDLSISEKLESFKIELNKISKPFQIESNNLRQALKSANLDVKLVPRLQILAGIYVLCLLTYLFWCVPSAPSIKYELPLPTVLLKRTEFIAKIEKILSKDSQKTSIPRVALVGLGGVGKTTLARIFGRQHKGTVWEINAERETSLKKSFHDLARILAVSSTDRDKLVSIQQLPNPNDRDMQLMLFVKSKLKLRKNWLLIYDNVDSFTKILLYFPTDPSVWGIGKVIVTTRNSNMQGSEFFNDQNTLHINELTEKEALKLFLSITCTDKPVSTEEQAKISYFLKRIPPFPLDIAVAGTYIQNSSISHVEYLKRLMRLDFHITQTSLLSESSSYAKTRQEIIGTSIELILSIRPEFEKLLLFLSVINSQRVPRELLEFHTDPLICDCFLHEMKKYSLIKADVLAGKNQTLSMHRSTQEICLSYLTQKYKTPEALNHSLTSIVRSIESYGSDTLDQEDLDKLILIEPHLESVYAQEYLIPFLRGSIGAVLGGVRAHLERNDVETKPLLEKSVNDLKQSLTLNKKRMAQALTYLGDMYRSLGKYDKAITILNQALDLQSSEDIYSINQARALSYLGGLLRQKGDYERALECLTKSLSIYQKHKLNNKSYADVLTGIGLLHRDCGNYLKAKEFIQKGLTVLQNYRGDPIGCSWTYAYLASVYIELGEYQPPKQLLESTLDIFNKTYGKDSLHSAWVLSYLGGIYKEHNNLKQALNILETGRNNYETRKSEIYVYFKVLLLNLGNLYCQLGRYEEARVCLQRSLHLLERHYGKGHLQTAATLCAIGNLEFARGNLQTAEGYMQQALGYLIRNNHVDAYKALENLASIYACKSNHSLKYGDKYLSLEYLKKANDCLVQALTIIENKLPPKSEHIKRIRKKLKELKS